jgi:hypothetical protein
MAGNIEPGWYIGAGAGGSMPKTGGLFKKKDNSNNTKNIKYSASPGFDALAGYKINRFFRTDLAGQYRGIKMSGDDIKI